MKKILIIIFLFVMLLPTVSADVVNKIGDMTPEQDEDDLCPCNIALCVEARSPVGIMNITFYSNLSGPWDYMYLGTENVTFTNVPNGTYCVNVPYFNEYDTTYYWKVEVEDTVSVNTSAIFHFTTTDDESRCEGGGGGTSYSWLIGVIIIFTIMSIFIMKSKKFRR